MSDFLENFTTTPAIKIFLFVLASAAIAAFALAFIIIFIGLDGTGDETPEGDEIHLIIIRIEEEGYGDQSDEDGARYE